MSTGVPRGMERYVVRVGHDEREACQGELLEQHLAGRLSPEELDRRQQAAMEAVTVADLERLLVDLPASRRSAVGALSGGRRPDRPWRSLLRLAVPTGAVVGAGSFLGVAVAGESDPLTTSAALATGAVGVVTGWWAGRRR